MGSPKPPKPPNLIFENNKILAKNNKAEYYNSVKTAISTGDIESGWGREILKGLRPSQSPITPNVNRKRNYSQSPKPNDNEQATISTGNNNADIDNGAEGPWIAPSRTARNKKKTTRKLTNSHS